MRYFIILLTIWVIATGKAKAGPVVELTDTQGRSAEVELLSKTDTHVTIRYKSGKVASVERSKLTPLCRGHITNWKPGTDEVPGYTGPVVAQKPNRATNRATVPVAKPAPRPVRRSFGGCRGGVCR